MVVPRLRENLFPRRQAHPCEAACVYAKHAEHNDGYRKGTPWPAGKYALSWGHSAEAYKQKYGKELPPSGQKFMELKLRRQGSLKCEREPDNKQ